VLAAVADPDNATAGALFDALLAMVTVPVKLPVAVGANLTLTFADCPAPMVMGNAAPEILKALPLTVAAVTDRFDPPVFEIMSVWVELLFAVMLLKLNALGETAIVAAALVAVIVADADFVVSAVLVAFTVYLPALAGAVYIPFVDTVPPLADQVMPVLLVPVTVATNCCVPPVFTVAELGLIETATVGAAVTLTLAIADLVESAALVAFTV
jgi:hypothetical protein